MVDRHAQHLRELAAHVDVGWPAHNRGGSRSRERIPRNHDPWQVGAQADEYCHAAQAQQHGRTHPDDNLKSEERRKAQEHSERDRCGRASGIVLGPRQLFQSGAKAR